MELIALLGSDREAWGQVSALINRGTWEKVILVKTQGATDYPSPEGVESINIDSTRPLAELKQDLTSRLKNSFSEFEACLSIASGNGKEHMALIGALLSVPVGIRLVAFTKNGVEFLT